VARTPIRVTIYSKADCHLCEEMDAVVAEVGRERPLEVEHVDITTDPALAAKYGHEIPVMLIEGRKAFKGRCTDKELRAKLDKAQATAEKHAPLESLEAEERWSPPAPLAALVLVGAIGGAAYFVAEGVAAASRGRESLTAQLLAVEGRGQPMIDFELPKADGTKLSLSSLSGKVVFLNFWATWCPPCVEEMPSLRRLREKFAGHPNFEMLLVSTDDEWGPVKKFFEGDDPPFTVLLDADKQIAGKYGTSKFPETFILKDGRIHSFIMGPRDWDTWFAEAYLAAILGG